MLRFLTFSIVAFLAGPASAFATSAKLEALDRSGAPYTLVVRGDDGEPNRIRLAFDGDGVTITDAGARRMTPGGQCRSVDAATLRCALPDGVFVAGRDGDDHLVAPDVVLPVLGVEVSGGPGEDRVDGSRHADRLYGGPGDDVLRGLGGDDFLVDAERAVREMGRDRFEGGPGRDVVSYQGRSSRVRVDLGRPGRAGARGEGDRLTSIEGAAGGRGRDTLLGSRRADQLNGEAGRDRVDGRDGDDLIVGGDDPDMLRGGAGDDRFEDTTNAADLGGPDRVLCGPGDDLVKQGLGLEDVVTESCERLKLDGGGTVRLDLRLRVAATDLIAAVRGAVAGRASLWSGRRRIARGPRLRLDARARRVVRARRCVTVRLTVGGDVQSLLRACRS